MVKIKNLKKNSNWNMRQTPGQMHMQMPSAPPWIANFLKYHGLDKVKTDT